MKKNVSASPYKGFRFPPEIIGYAVWLYFRFPLSFRDVEELMAERGIVLTYETVRHRCVNLSREIFSFLSYSPSPQKCPCGLLPGWTKRVGIRSPSQFLMIIKKWERFERNDLCKRDSISKNWVRHVFVDKR